MVLRLFTLALD
uniref:Uncharacterized protein n=1 Tax=Anguilla anguilla TaxID=7936 RepID=A0A0E9RLX2_ANGAN